MHLHRSGFLAGAEPNEYCNQDEHDTDKHLCNTDEKSGSLADAGCNDRLPDMTHFMEQSLFPSFADCRNDGPPMGLPPFLASILIALASCLSRW